MGQKCDKGFKANGATTNEANTCPKDQKVSTDGKCAGSPCNAKDEGTCCNMKCNDEKEGFKKSGDKTGKAPLSCSTGETVDATKYCKGKCVTASKKDCCLSATNSSGQTSDAHSAGLMAAVSGVLICLSAWCASPNCV